MKISLDKNEIIRIAIWNDDTSQQEKECAHAALEQLEAENAALRTRLAETQSSMVRHFNEEHLAGDGPEIDRWRAENAALKQERDSACEYLVRLLKHCYPEIQPLGDLSGLCSQVDNGLAVGLTTARQQLANKRPAFEHANAMIGKLEADNVALKEEKLNALMTVDGVDFTDGEAARDWRDNATPEDLRLKLHGIALLTACRAIRLERAEAALREYANLDNWANRIYATETEPMPLLWVGSHKGPDFALAALAAAKAETEEK